VKILNGVGVNGCVVGDGSVGREGGVGIVNGVGYDRGVGGEFRQSDCRDCRLS